MNEDAQLSPQETAMFQALVKPGVVYLLMLRLGRPTGAREVADILGIHEQTAARYLRVLARLNLVARTNRYNGYVVLGGQQLILGELHESPTLEELEDPVGPGNPDDPGQLQEPDKNSQYRKPEVEGPDCFGRDPAGTMKISQSPPIIINRLINSHLNDSVVIDSGTSKNSHSEPLPKKDEVWRELNKAGIFCNTRTQALVRLPHLSPEYVRGHRLKLAESGKDGPKWTGLLITILERGDPAPELNPGGHLASCKCPDCHRRGIARSWG